LEFPAFNQFLISFALIGYSRPPHDMRGRPAVESIHKLIETFKKATKKKGFSTLLYEDPDAADPKDHDLIQLLNVKLLTDPDYPLPEGFLKVKSRLPENQYILPQATA
jgi:hypothetical protein